MQVNITLEQMPEDHTDDKSTSVHGLMLSGNMPLPEAVLTKIYNAIGRHKATIS